MSGGKSSRAKGAKYERKIAAFLRDELDIDAERRLEQWRSGGDDLVHDFEAWLSIEAKDVAASSLGSWIDQSVRSAGHRVAVVFHHRRGNGDPARDFVTMTGADFVAVCLALRSLARLAHGRSDAIRYAIPEVER